jgi:hypothetical protein
MVPSEYVIKWPGARWRSERTEEARREGLRAAVTDRKLKGARKRVKCPTCLQPVEVSLFAGKLHDWRCSDCKAEDELMVWVGKTEPEDYVSCRECGHRAVNLTSHIMNAHPGLSYGKKYPTAQVVALNAGQRASWSSYEVSREDLLKFAGGEDRVIVASVCRAYGCAPNTVVRWCRELGLRTKNRFGWQKAVLDEAAAFLGEKYEWEWTDERIRNPSSQHVLHYDGFFPSRNLIIEAHGDQHFFFIEAWHRTYEEFERLRELDRFKLRRAQELGFTVKVVRYGDAIHERGFWRRLLEDDRALWANKSESERRDDVEMVLRELRVSGFPNILPSPKTRAEFTKLQRQTIYLDSSGMIRPQTTRGTTACASFFPNRYRARYKGIPSVLEAWDDDDRLRRAIRVQMEAGHPTTPHRVLRALQMICRTPSVFRPGVAKYVCQTYCREGGTVWDPCAGYGGRLFGAMATHVGTYLGTDVEFETVEGNRRLAQEISVSDRCRVVQAAAEEFDPEFPLDLVFTSPPYYDLESYGSRSDSQAYSDVGEWLECFLVPLINKGAERLRSGAYLVLNLPAKPCAGAVLADEAVKIAIRAGLGVQPVVFMPVRRLRTSRSAWKDPLVVFRKP